MLELKDYDSAKYLEEVKEAKKFHELVTGIKFDLNTVIDVIDEQSDQLNRYFRFYQFIVFFSFLCPMNISSVA